MQDHSLNVPPKEVFGTEDSFRAELAKLDPENIHIESAEEAVDETPQIPDDVKNAADEVNKNAEETEPQESAADNEAMAEEVETKGHLIPKSRFKQEIEKRKVLEEQLSKEREERIRYETQLQMLDQMQKQQVAVDQQNQARQQQEELSNIDPLDTETYNYAKHEIEQLKQQLATVAQETEARTREMFNVNTVTAQEAAFSKDHPDFKDAMEHVQKVELDIAKNLFGNEQQAHAYVADKLRHTLTNSINSGRNAAETIYNMAKTYGFNSAPKPTSSKPSVNVEAIAKNMDRGANTSDVGNSGTFGNIPVDIKAALDKSGRVDPALFQQILSKAQRNY